MASRRLGFSWFCFAAFVLSNLASQGYGCGFPGAPAHSIVGFSPEGPIGTGTVASYSCDRGFELLGPPRRICQEDGTWSPQGIPFCVLNVAGGKAPMQSSIAENGSPQKALDGRAGSTFSPETCSLTKRERTAPWWYVNLLEPYLIQVVRIDFGKSCCGNRNATIVIRVGNKRPDRGVNAVCNRFTGLLEEGKPLYFPCNPPTRGAFVSVHLEAPIGEPLSICEAFVYTDQALPIERCPTFRDQPPGSTATYHGKCYIFYNRQQLAFPEAKRFCSERGGTLVDETNPALQGFLSWELYRRHRVDPRAQYWLGATRDPVNRANWKWVDGTDMSVSFWYLPGGNEDCARFDGTLRWLWSDTNCNAKLNFICQHQPEGCGRPEQPPNSTIVAQSFAVGSTIEYRCDPGHLIVGPSQRTCLRTGFFNEFPPSCRYVECGPPAPIPNGYYELVNGTRSYLSVVRYECNEGYALVDRGELVCDVDRRWNGPPPRCEPVNCAIPASIDNGSYRIFTSGEPSTTPYIGDVVEYSCNDESFELEGDHSITCMPNGKYDRSPPVCKEMKKPTQAPPPATQKPTYRLPPPLRPSQKPKPTVFTRPTTVESNDDNDVDLARPGDNEIPDSVNFREQVPPGINVPRPKEEQKSLHQAKLNLGGVIALGVFGGFVFLAAVITTIVILVRRNQNANRMRHNQRSPDSDTISSMDSSGSESRGLNRYYKRAWENLREAPPSQTKGGKQLPTVYRPETLESPNFRGGSANEGMRDGGEMVISDAFAKPSHGTSGRSAEKKRHHHHHHHHHSHKKRQQQGYPSTSRGGGAGY